MAEISPRGAARGAARAVEGAAHEAAPWVERLARVGFVARGVVYIAVGVLAARAASHRGGRPEGTEGALGEIVFQPFGRVLLAVMALGLLGFALWRMIDAVLDPERRGTEPKAVGKRVSVAVSGITHAFLGLTAARLAMGSSEGGREGSARLVASVMDKPFGRFAVMLAGAIIVGRGAYEIYRAYTGKLTKKLALGGVEPHTREGIEKAALAGGIARGVVFAIVGVFVFRAALKYRPSEAGGVGGALETIRGGPMGAWVLMIVAIGLVAFGVFELAEARYRRIHPA